MSIGEKALYKLLFIDLVAGRAYKFVPMEFSNNQKNMGAPEVHQLKLMKSMIHDLRRSKVNLRTFIQKQSQSIDVLSQPQQEWKKEYIGLVLQIDNLSTANPPEESDLLSEDKVLKIERLIKAMEFMLTMAEKKTLK